MASVPKGSGTGTWKRAALAGQACAGRPSLAPAAPAAGGEGGEGQRPPESSGRASRGFCAVCLRPPSPRARASLQEARAPRFHRLGNCTTYSTSKLGTGRREGFVKRSSQEGKRPHLPLPGTRGSAPRNLCRGGGNRALAWARPWLRACACVVMRVRVRAATCVHVPVRARVHLRPACVHAHECTCVRACVHARVCMHTGKGLQPARGKLNAHVPTRRGACLPICGP